jgi:outer membrane protein assembly factor BamE (lipoprotein component of BamABCDE complex)
MALNCRRLTLVAGAAALMFAVGGCARVRTHKGYLVDRLLIESVSPGIDNKESVQASLGQPTFATQFGPEEWYYVSRDAQSLAYRKPKPVDQMVLRVRFDAAGNVTATDRLGMDQVARIEPVHDKTPTLGRHRTLFEELFGNIGTVGAGGAGAGGGGGGTGGGGPNGS